MDVREIENAIASLPPTEIAKLAKWFEEFQNQIWDQRIERDLKLGRLDPLLEEAQQDLESGRCDPL